MKTSLLVRIFFTFIVSFLTVAVNAQSTTATIGVVNNKEGVITNQSEAIRVLKGGLSAQAVVTRAWIELSPTENKYYLIGQISNDPISGKAVQLHQNGSEIYAAMGTGIQVTCNGYNCGTCYPNIKGGKARCVCTDPNPGTGSRCDMSTTVTIGW